MSTLTALSVDAMRAAHAFSDDRHDAVRRFRNALIVATIFTALLAAAIVLLGMAWPKLMPVCAPKACPTGGTAPTGGDVALIALFGSLGAVLAVVSTLSTMGTPETPYSLNGPQLLLKIPVGALTGLVAVIALHAALVNGVEPLKSQAALLIYATAFGYAQQAATRLVDQRAQSVQDAARP